MGPTFFKCFLFLWRAERHADVLATILARMSMSVSVSVAASWNASFNNRPCRPCNAWRLRGSRGPCANPPNFFSRLTINITQEAFEKCWAHSPLRATARRIAIHQVSLLSHAVTVARRLRIDVLDDDDYDDNDNA